MQVTGSQDPSTCTPGPSLLVPGPPRWAETCLLHSAWSRLQAAGGPRRCRGRGRVPSKSGEVVTALNFPSSHSAVFRDGSKITDDALSKEAEEKEEEGNKER
eukprot:768387-Hanusia_phi.AAC.1